ncbi:hypothetical protein J4G37_35785, partial [Microvirga sp. 3-52]|nr:hypothetical protein [Microvirga sp. 3-52]
MTGISLIESYLPSKQESISDLSENLGLTTFQTKLLTRIHGLEKIRYDPEETLFNLLKEPIIKILPKVDSSKIKYILYAHTIQNVTPHTINIVEQIKEEFNLKHAISFSVTQHNCASALTAIEIASHLLKKGGDNVLLITGEKAFTPSAQVIPNTSIMGEGSSASILTRNSEKNKLLSMERTILGKYYSGIYQDSELLKEFEKTYVKTLCNTISRALKTAKVRLEDLKIIIPHNVNKTSWLRVADYLQINKNKIYLNNISEFGHCFSSDPFINYSSIEQAGLL